MASGTYTSQSIPYADLVFNGGLNSTSSPLNLKNNESSDLQNIDFDRFGAISKRNGYSCLNTNSGTAIGVDGLYWYEYDNAGTKTRYAIRIYNSNFQKMDALDGVWDTMATSNGSITSGNFFDFATFNNIVFATNGVDPPLQWAGTGSASTSNVPAALTDAKYVEVYENYLFYGNVIVDSTSRTTRIYWSALRDHTSWDGADWIEIALNDGQEITGLKTLGNALVVYKTRSIYNVFFTGSADAPFRVIKSNSSVGCTASGSIQEVKNGHVFFSTDGFYFYNGEGCEKISDKITTTILGYNTTNFTKMRSLHYAKKNQVWWTFTDSGETTNDKIVVWDYYNNAWSIYDGINASALATFIVDGINERPYFADYNGFVYRADTGNDDYALNTANAINSYYYTNWRGYNDIVNKKGVSNAYLYYEDNSCILTMAYAYDLEEGDTYSQLVNLSVGGSVWDTFIWDDDNWAGSGGKISRLDLTGRGRLVRFKMANATSSETFKIYGLGQLPHLETKA